MSKGTYLGVANKAKRIKKQYIGVGGKAKKIKRGYVGVNGKAKLMFSADKQIIELPELQLNMAVGNTSPATVGDYVLFLSGGTNGNTDYYEISGSSQNTVFDSQLTKIETSLLPSTYNYGMLSSTTIPATSNQSEKAIFAGGAYGTGSVANELMSFDDSLTKIQGTMSGSFSATFVQACTFQGVAAFAPILYSSSRSDLMKIDNSLSVTRQQMTYSLPNSRRATAANENYMLVAGGMRYGYGNTFYNALDIFSTSFTQLARKTIQTAKRNFSGIANEEYFVFAGEGESADAKEVLEVLDQSLTAILGIRASSRPQSYASYKKAISKVDDFIVYKYFNYNPSYINRMDCYDKSLTITKSINYTYGGGITYETYLDSIVNFKDYILIAGGYHTSTGTRTLNNIKVFKAD